MGPAQQTSINIFESPRLESTTEKYIWRQNVRLWAEQVLDYAEGGDNRANGVANTLCLTLYSCMNFGHQQLVNRSVDAGELCLRKSTNATNNERLDEPEKGIQLVARDSVSDSVRRKV